MGYNYLHEDAFDGSLLPLPTLHKAIWAYIVAKAKPDPKATGGGAVWLVPRLMAVYFPDASMTDIEGVIEFFCKPDPDTRTDTHEGRKLIPMGRDRYAIPTYHTHAGSRLARDAERKRQERADRLSSGTLIPNQFQLEKLRETHAFVGSRLRVPKVLHEELRNKIGSDGETKLQAWYLRLDEEIENSGEAVPDIFEWLRPRFIGWCKFMGLVKPAEKTTPQKRDRSAINAALSAEMGRKRAAR